MPRCNFKLGVAPIPRPLRFHDIRHSAASLLLEAGAPLAIVQRVLRHSDPAITVSVHGGIEVGDMRLALDQLGDRIRPGLRPLSGEKKGPANC